MTTPSPAAMPVDPSVDFRRYLREDHFLGGRKRLARLALALYRRLVLGAPVVAADLAPELSLSVDAADALISELPPSTLDRDGTGGIVAFGGLSQTPARQAFMLGGRTLHTWCVFDALFLPAILGRSAISVSRCPASGREIEIALSPNCIEFARPPSPVMSIVAPGRDACCNDLRGAFCNHVSFFADEGSFLNWTGGRADIGWVTLREAHDLARLRNAYLFGDLLHAA